MWGATKLACTHLLASSFNSRTPCGVRPVNLSTSLSFALFQFTHPVWGATTSEDYPATPYLRFQFTHPVWGATIGEGALRIAREVSIHAPRVGCDTSQSTSRASTAGFNSRTPCGVRLNNAWADARSDKVSIHAPRVGCDLTRWKQRGAWAEFQFTHPVWGATTNS